MSGMDDLERMLRDAIKTTFEARAAAYDEQVVSHALQCVCTLCEPSSSGWCNCCMSSREHKWKAVHPLFVQKMFGAESQEANLWGRAKQLDKKAFTLSNSFCGTT